MSEPPLSDPLVTVSIKIRHSQRERTKAINLSEKIRDWIDKEYP